MCGYMQQKILNFIKYNNAFTIIFVICFFGFSITFAANPDVRESVYASEETVISVDNGLIVSADLDNFNFNLRISAVTEDDKNYYAAYSYQTLVIENDVWQNKEIEKILTVSKEALDGRDLGLYVAKELGENINYELSYLKRVQKLEREKGESQKIVATEYSGLIGKLLDPKEEVIEGYNPVIPEPAPEVAATVESNPEEVIVSTPRSEPSVSATAPQEGTVLSAETSSESTATEATSTPTQNQPAQEATSTPNSAIAPLPEPEITPPPQDDGEGDDVVPAPEEMIDEELVQEVVTELLQTEETPAPAPTPVSEPEVAPQP